NQDLYDVTSRVLLAMRGLLKQTKPDVVVVQGDTTTCFAAALAAFYQGITVAHVEAGLRTGDLSAPFPEEANRALTSRLAAYHFAPTEQARCNLIAEAVPSERIWVTGNTVIDALLMVHKSVSQHPVEHWIDTFGEDVHERIASTSRRLVLVTGHRRENFGKGFSDLCGAIADLARRHADWDFLYPVHLNPNVRTPVYQILGGLRNVALIEPLDYAPFVWLMAQADLILTDSGGVQEEAPSLGVPVLVMRVVTERPEAVNAGTVRLVGTDPERIVANVEELLTVPTTYERMAHAINPYGDGLAARRIVEVLTQAHGSSRSDRRGAAGV
ncbi:MAG: non-hydrolyzing UDP-N-acetylglucosamine 2-epimerase, partial [Gammaproteobacteria bacterium]